MGGGSSGGGGEAEANVGLNPNTPPPFLSKTYDMVDDPATDAVISWGSQNNSFVVWNQSEFARSMLPKYFKHGNFSSFVRQLNTYGFKKVDPDRWEFANEGFLRGQKHMLKNINRRKSSHAHHQAPLSQPQNSSFTACVEVCKFGLEEEIEKLKRDKNVLMQELIRLRQQQQGTDNQLQTLGKRLQGMERRQQLMMSFLAKAMQSPGLFAQLAHQNESNHQVAAPNKKRRLPRQESSGSEERSDPLDGQIIKYQLSTNDAGAALLAQMLKCDTPPRLDELINNSDGILADNFPSPPEPLAGGSSLDHNPGVTHAEVPQKSEVHPFMAMSSGYSAACSSSAISDEIQSKVGIADTSVADMIQDTSMLSVVQGAMPCECPENQEIVLDGIVGGIPIDDFVMPVDESMFIKPVAMALDAFLPMEEVDDDEKLIMELLGECMAASPPQSGETEEVASSTHEAIDKQPLTSASGSTWNNVLNMDNITAQMGVLASDSRG